ncbi:TonB-dependent receptor domain-containing protein [Woodsholea maritima]|uniref:TonB-dependent receptor domain-containing protein n=1 Tax=Woodsholea maritima TaxID=240237 RepID=UPI000381678E|nr:TonB-dependent receptor [Woodsholea maritima]
MTKFSLGLASALLLCVASAPLATAQNTAASDSSMMSYDSEFFAQFNALTALDMVQQVPGFTIDDGDNRRGLAGALSNVLVNGNRVSTKGSGAFGTLRRIPASDVVSIELIRGNVPGIDMRGQSSVVNVHLKEGAGTSGSTRLRLTHWESNRIMPSGEASMTFAGDNHDITFGVELNSAGGGNPANRKRYNSVGELTDHLEDRDHGFFYEASPFMNATYNFANGDTFTFSAQGWNWHDDWYGISRHYDGQGRYVDIQEQDRDVGGFVYNLNAEYEHAFSETLSLKFIGFYRDGNRDARRDFTTLRADGPLDHRALIDDEVEFGEQILRSQLSWTPQGPHSFEFTAERAFNFRDSDFLLQEDDGSGLARVALPVSNTRVEEVRWDFSASHGWQIRENLNLETILAWETSTISQSGDAEQERDLQYFKPNVTLTWDLDPQNQIRLKVEREIGQLNFEDFISSVDVRDSQTNTGNPNLEPTQAWLAEAVWERRFGEDATITLTANHREYDAVSGTVALGGGLSEGPGNLENGKRSELIFDANLPLDRIGLRGAVLEPIFALRHSEVTDPFTGETRPIPGVSDWRFDVDFRQDFQNLGWAWGFDYHYASEEDVYRLRENRYIQQSKGDLDIFVETSRYFGVTTRLGVDGLIHDAHVRRRVFFDPLRANGQYNGEEIRETNFYRTIYLEVTKTF